MILAATPAAALMSVCPFAGRFSAVFISEAFVPSEDCAFATPSSSSSKKSNPVRTVCCSNAFSGKRGTFIAGMATARSMDAIMNVLQRPKLTFLARSQRYATRNSPLHIMTSIM